MNVGTDVVVVRFLGGGSMMSFTGSSESLSVKGDPGTKSSSSSESELGSLLDLMKVDIMWRRWPCLRNVLLFVDFSPASVLLGSLGHSEGTWQGGCFLDLGELSTHYHVAPDRLDDDDDEVRAL